MRDDELQQKNSTPDGKDDGLEEKNTDEKESSPQDLLCNWTGYRS